MDMLVKQRISLDVLELGLEVFGVVHEGVGTTTRFGVVIESFVSASAPIRQGRVSKDCCMTRVRWAKSSGLEYEDQLSSTP